MRSLSISISQLNKKIGKRSLPPNQNLNICYTDIQYNVIIYDGYNNTKNSKTFFFEIIDDHLCIYWNRFMY